LAALGAAAGAAATTGAAGVSSVFLLTFLATDLAGEALIILLEEVEVEDILRTGLIYGTGRAINFLVMKMPEKTENRSAFVFILKRVTL
jgi:hypothetical protein